MQLAFTACLFVCLIVSVSGFGCESGFPMLMCSDGIGSLCTLGGGCTGLEVELESTSALVTRSERV